MMLWKEKRLPVPWRWLSSRLPRRISQALSVPFLTIEFTAPLHLIITWVCQEWLTVTHQWLLVHQQDLPLSDEGLRCALGAEKKGCREKNPVAYRGITRVALEFAWPFFTFRNVFTLTHVKKWFLPGFLSGPVTCQARSSCRAFVHAVPSAVHALSSLLCLLYRNSSFHSQFMEKTLRLLA